MLSRSPARRRRRPWRSMPRSRRALPEDPGVGVGVADRGGGRGVRRRRVLDRDARSPRLLLLDRPHQIQPFVARRLVGTAAGEQLVEHDSQRVDVAGGGDRLVADLFRAGVGDGHRLDAGAGHLEGGGAGVVEGFGDAEVEELGLAVGADQDVAGLQSRGGRSGSGAPDGPRSTPCGRARDARGHSGRGGGSSGRGARPRRTPSRSKGSPSSVVPPSSSLAMLGWSRLARTLALVVEAADDRRGAQPRPQELDRDPLLELVDSQRQEHRAHAAAAEEPLDAVGADPTPDHGRLGPESPRSDRHQVGTVVVGGPRVRQQGLDLPLQLEVVAAGLLQGCLLLRSRQVQEFVEDRLDALPELGSQRLSPPVEVADGAVLSSRLSQVLAARHLRLAVEKEMPSTSEISSTVRPVK